MGSLMENGFENLYSFINQKEVSAVKKHLRQFLSLPSLHDRLTLKYHIRNLEGENMLIKHEILLRKLEKHFLAVNYFFDVTEKERIEQYFENTNAPKNQHNKLNISARESEVLQLVGEGYSSKQIADKLFISNHTAISHRKNLIEKFQVKNTAHLIKKASELIPSF